jgi:virginiamycin B lyase
VGLALAGLGVAAPPALADLVTEFPVPRSVVEPGEITAGPDGAMWFISSGFGSVDVDKIWRITPAGAVTEFGLPRRSDPKAIAAGFDGAIWYTGVRKIGRVTAAGAVREFGLPGRSKPVGIAAGPDRAQWFADRGLARIGRITARGELTYFRLPRGSMANWITVGPDRALWFTELRGSRVGRMSQTGAVRRYRSPIPELSDIAGGLDGGVWFTEFEGRRLGRITPGGRTRRYRLPSCDDEIGSITAGPDRAIWFTHDLGIGRIATSGEVTEFRVRPEPDISEVESRLKTQNDIALGPDGAIWFTESIKAIRRGREAGKIGRIDLRGHGSEILVTKLARRRYNTRPRRRLSLRYTTTHAARVAVELRRGCRTLSRRRQLARAGSNAVTVRAPRKPGRYELRLRAHVRGQVATDTASLRLGR